jgi:hypothetical protein
MDFDQPKPHPITGGGFSTDYQVDPFTYLKEFMERLPTHPADRLAELLPDAWFAAHPDARSKVAS